MSPALANGLGWTEQQHIRPVTVYLSIQLLREMLYLLGEGFSFQFHAQIVFREYPWYTIKKIN